MARLTLCCCLLALATRAVALVIDPDVTQLTIPPNIAPLNFDVLSEKDVSVSLRSSNGQRLDYDTPNVRIPLEAWRAFLHDADHYVMTICEDASPSLVVTNTVARESIDKTLAYRLIAPSYQNYGPIGLYQRDLTSFQELPIYSNMQSSPRQCMNCHSFKQGDPETFLFHLRAESAGTVIYRGAGDEGVKKNFKVGPFFSSGVYPSWHPSGDFVAFSVNETLQSFYSANLNKIEVLDARSDMMLYDVRRDEVLPVELEPGLFDCFPSWSPDGTQLYSVAATPGYEPSYTGEKDARERLAVEAYTNLCYNLIVRDFDREKRTFSPYKTVLDAAKQHRSITLPRVSPDGRWLVFTLGPQGVFHIWHKEADLWLMDLKLGACRPITEINSPDVESYHAFSSNGAWMVFSTRRDDGAFTRPYIAHFDTTTGQFSKPFRLPQFSPKANRERLLSYNIPEFVTGPITRTPRQIHKLAKQPATKPTPVTP